MKQNNKVAGLILAAGASSRMGEPKQLLTLGKNSLIEQILLQVLQSELDSAILVLGSQAEKIKESINSNKKVENHY